MQSPVLATVPLVPKYGETVSSPLSSALTDLSPILVILIPAVPTQYLDVKTYIYS